MNDRTALEAGGWALVTGDYDEEDLALIRAEIADYDEGSDDAV